MKNTLFFMQEFITNRDSNGNTYRYTVVYSAKTGEKFVFHGESLSNTCSYICKALSKESGKQVNYFEKVAVESCNITMGDYRNAEKKANWKYPCPDSESALESYIKQCDIRENI